MAIAEKIIDQSEIGLRLYAAIEGPAAEFLEDVPAKTFGGIDGWRVLVRILRDKYDEPRMHKVGAAMRNFFNLQLAADKTATLRDVADYMDQAARQCRDAGLEIPDAVMIYFFFQHSNSNMDRQANLLLRTGGEYDWPKIKQAIDLLYPNVVVRHGGQAGKGYRGRGAHEAQQQQHSESYQNDWTWAVPEPGDDAASIEDWIYNNDPIEALAGDQGDVSLLPEPLARELHGCFNSHRENRQKLARAVQARGYYVKGKGKGGKKGGKSKSSKGKGSGGSKGKKGSGGKARGMSLEELKASTACSECGQIGHWHDDPECPARRKSNVVGSGDGHQAEPAGGEDEYGYYHEWDETYEGDEWAEEWYEQEAPRSSNAASRE